MIVAIDGEAGSGKTTVSRIVARQLGFALLESGSLYRAIALKAVNCGVDLADEAGMLGVAENSKIELRADNNGNRLFLDGNDVTEQLHAVALDQGASMVGRLQSVREKLLPMQRRMAQNCSLVAEGRDMGTVVFPSAEHKFYLKASLEVRSERRKRQLAAAGNSVSKEDLAGQMMKRDKNDSSRRLAPMRPAPDAEIIDTTAVDADTVAGTIVSRVQPSLRRSAGTCDGEKNSG
jgi:cytidylate kinase